MGTTSLVNLNDDLKVPIFQYLQIAEYASIRRTCKAMNKFCSDLSTETAYWRETYRRCYSSKQIQEEPIGAKNPWKNRIRLFEERLKEQKIFSKKFRVCVELKCEKMGSLKKDVNKVDSAILTICLKDLVANDCKLDDDAKIELAKKLLDCGADPLKETNVFLEDFPLRIAFLKGRKKMVDLFFKYIDKNEENKTVIHQLIAGLESNHPSLLTLCKERAWCNQDE